MHAWIGFVGAALVASQTLPAPRATLAERFDSDVSAFLARHCSLCHGGDAPEAGLDFAPFDSLEALERREARWRHAVRRVELDQMPPLGPMAPSDDERARFLGFARAAAVLRYDPALPPDPGASGLRRLARREVANSLYDLLGLRVDLDGVLPEDQVASGFDNLASAQSLAPHAVDRWLHFAVESAAFAAPRAAFGASARVVERRAGAVLEGGSGGGQLYNNGEVKWTRAFERGGRYRLRVALAADQAGPDLARAALRLDATSLLTAVEVAARRGAAPTLAECDLVLPSGGEYALCVGFLNDYWRPDDPDPRARDRNLVVEWIEIEGPLDPPEPSGFERMLEQRFGALVHPTQLEAWVAHAGLLLWRRPLERDAVERLCQLAPAEATLDERFVHALVALIASPRFLFRMEPNPEQPPAGGWHAIDGFALATRLAFFLWSSAPDGALLEAAGRGALGFPEGRAETIQQMLDDPRASALADDFAVQWLALRRLEARALESDPDDARLFTAMVDETRAFVDAVVREGRPIAELIRAPYTFVNAELARHYGMQGDFDPRGGMRRVMHADGVRRGLLGHASVLTATSEPQRTSPVQRGVFVLDALLGAPPAPPPPEIPALDTRPAIDGSLDLTDRLAVHRAEPRCATCHDSIDPLGLALEGFGPRGEWRGLGLEGDGAAGAASLDTLVEDVLSDGRFLRTVLERLYVHALGRALGPAERGEIARWMARLDPERATFRDAIHAIAESPAFRFTRAQSE